MYVSTLGLIHGVLLPQDLEELLGNEFTPDIAQTSLALPDVLGQTDSLRLAPGQATQPASYYSMGPAPLVRFGLCIEYGYGLSPSHSKMTLRNNAVLKLTKMYVCIYVDEK
jgi:hypothetical protein